MKVSAVQLQPIAGNIETNIAKHLNLIKLAVDRGAGLVFFSELSLTGYEPRLANSLAVDISDSRLDIFQERSDTANIVIGVGVPLKATQVQIGTVWFAPGSPRRSYAKQQLHDDELPFFVPGEGQIILEAAGQKFAPAICYESLQSSHAIEAKRLGADVYLASVAKPRGGLAKAMLHYPAIARKHKMHVIMANCIGPNDNFMSVGQSAAWNSCGKLLEQMDRESEGILLMDTLTEQTSMHTLMGI